ncbi:MAG: hypothetical protein AB7I30_21405, partial [Isosphaeraceae bacterium]
MTSSRSTFRITFAALTLAVAATSARADLVRYEMFGEPGNQVSTAPTFLATGLSGVSLARGPGLSPNAGANSINSAGWSTDPTDFYVMGFDLLPGYTALVNRLLFAGRSSNTGPGFINVFYSINNAPEVLLSNFALSGTAFNNQDINFAPIAVSGSLRVYFRAANTTSANGGTIGATGTVRRGDHSPDGGATFSPIT